MGDFIGLVEQRVAGIQKLDGGRFVGYALAPDVEGVGTHVAHFQAIAQEAIAGRGVLHHHRPAVLDVVHEFLLVKTQPVLRIVSPNTNHNSVVHTQIFA